MTLLPFRRRLPLNRGECVDAPRPCLFTNCRFHIATPMASGRGYHGTPTESCALDVAARGEHTTVEVGEAMGISKQRVMQLENSALKKLARNAAARRLEK